MEENKNELKVESPCHMRWSELKGDGSKRWCDECALHVVDGASLTRAEATNLVEESEERVCMRIVRDADGRILHAEDAPRAGVMGRVLRYGLTAAAGLMVACGDERKDPADETPPDTSAGTVDPTERPVEIMGEVCFPEEMQTEELGDVAQPREVLGSVALPTGEHGQEMVGRVALSLPAEEPVEVPVETPTEEPDQR